MIHMNTFAINSPQSISSRALLQDACRCFQDAGVNVNGTPPIVVQQFQLPLHRYPNPINVKFGNNGTFSSATHYTYIIGILGQVAVVPSLTNTIIGTTVMNKRGFDVIIFYFI